MARIEIALDTEVNKDIGIRNIKLLEDRSVLVANSFEALTILSPDDIKKLKELPVRQVTVLKHSIGSIGTSQGVYLLRNESTVTVTRHHSGSLKVRQLTAYMTISASTIEAFMDAYAMTLNDELDGLEIVPEQTETFGQIAAS